MLFYGHLRAVSPAWYCAQWFSDYRFSGGRSVWSGQACSTMSPTLWVPFYPAYSGATCQRKTTPSGRPFRKNRWEDFTHKTSALPHLPSPEFILSFYTVDFAWLLYTSGKFIRMRDHQQKCKGLKSDFRVFWTPSHDQYDPNLNLFCCLSTWGLRPRFLE